MYIKMKEDRTGSYNGVDHKLYKKDEVYSVNHPNEKNLFPIFVSSGFAEYYDPARPVKETKVALPKSSKKKSK